jgi:hypothetical protein
MINQSNILDKIIINEFIYKVKFYTNLSHNFLFLKKHFKHNLFLNYYLYT